MSEARRDGKRSKVEEAVQPQERPHSIRFHEAIMGVPIPLAAPELYCMFRKVPHPVIEDVALDMVIREADRAFWQACLTELEDTDPEKIRKRVAVIGSPGIGKSTTALFFIRTLLQIKKTVVYKMKDFGCYVIFSPGGVVTELPGNTPEEQIDALRRKETYYIIDPGKTKVNCNPNPNVKARVVIVASPDDRHWGGNDFSKDQPGWPGGLYWYFPAWTLPELRAAGAELSPPISSAVIEELFSVFGGVPRQVFSPRYEKQNREILKEKVEALSETQAKTLVSGRFNKHTGFGADQPQGGILIFLPTDDYEGVTVSLASISVRNWIRSTFMNAIWNDLALYPSPSAWQLLECYTIEAMMKTNEYTIRRSVGKSDASYAQTFQVELGGCTSQSLQSDCTSAVQNGDDLVLFYSSSPMHPLYDMIFKRNSVYYAIQVTIGRTRGAKRQQIADLARNLNIGEGGRELKLYYAVHETYFDVFVTDPVEPISPSGVSVYHLSLHGHL